MTEYEQHRMRANTEYLLEYEEWSRSMSDAERRELGKLADPSLLEDRVHGAVGLLGDIAESPMCSFTPDFAGEADGLSERIAEAFDVDMDRANRIAEWFGGAVDRAAAFRRSRDLAKIVGVFLEASNVKLTAAGLAFAAGMNELNGLGSMEEYGSSIGVSRQAVSKVAKFWQEELDIPAVGHMRSKEVCEAYRKAQTEKHWRNKKWSSEMKLKR